MCVRVLVHICVHAHTSNAYGVRVFVYLGMRTRATPTLATHNRTSLLRTRRILHETEKYLHKDLRVRRSDVLSAWQG